MTDHINTFAFVNVLVSDSSVDARTTFAFLNALVASTGGGGGTNPNVCQQYFLG
jgi:hypothetical protein